MLFQICVVDFLSHPNICMTTRFHLLRKLLMTDQIKQVGSLCIFGSFGVKSNSGGGFLAFTAAESSWQNARPSSLAILQEAVWSP